MMMKDLIIQNGGSDCMDGPEFEELIRLSHQGAEYSRDPYRCPVSTPAGYERAQERERNNSYMSFTSLNRSFEMPKHLAVPKHLVHRSMKYNRQATKPQKKNFDCYFVEKTDKTPVQNGSTWLTSLCSQPVDEIFNKYKRRSEAKYMAHRNSTKCRNVSTPGEKALVFAWSSNTSHRDSPSVMSRSTTEMTRKSQRSNPGHSLKVYGYESDPDRLVSSPGFALMPVPSPTIPDFDNVTWSSAGSVLNQKVNKATTSAASFVSESSGLTNTYESYQREKRFPTIRRKKSLSPAKKRITSEPVKHATSLPSGINKLEESPIEIISVGHFVNNEEVEPQKPVQTKPYCSYRLPKNPPSSLPELKGKG